MLTTVGLNRTSFERWNQPVEVDTAKHTAVIGTTGAGKTTVLKAMILAEIEAGHGVTVMEPHGSLIDDLLDAIPPHRRNDVILYDPGDPLNSIGMNPLEGEDKPKLLAEAEKIVSSVWKDAWGPQTSFLFRNFGEAILEVESEPTFLHIYKAFMVKEYRDHLAARVTSPTLKLFFDKYDDWDKRQQEQAAAPGTNKLDTFMQVPLRYAVTQRHGLDFSKVMDGSQILLCRFAKGRIGPTAGAFLGSVVIAKILYAALAREKTSHRPPHRVFIDEAGNFMCGSAHEQLLTEARKYNVSLTMGFQTRSQLTPETLSAVFGNIASLLIARVGAKDAEELGLEIGVPAETLQNLRNFWWYARTVKDGLRIEPIQMEGLRLKEIPKNEEVTRKIIERSNTRYATPISVIEKNIRTFLEGGKRETSVSGQSQRPQKAVRHGQGGGGQRPPRPARRDRRAVA
jgi:energy-coupling factor transporter ATP-binding protein EcfA2